MATRIAPASLTPLLLAGAAGILCGNRMANGADATPASLQIMIEPAGEAQSAPHGKGNVYAPEVRFENGLYRMWFGGQGRDGHDRIQLAESHDGVNWKSCGIVLEDPAANHVNDPSIIKRGDTYFMYYTRAASDILDEIALATSRDGIHWSQHGIVLRPSPPGSWDSLLVGRPSVLLEEDLVRMWYDGRKDLSLGDPAKGVPLAANSTRAVGYAESHDGIHWTRPQHTPIFTENAGGVHVSRIRSGYAMVYESGDGTRLATSTDGLKWKPQGLLAKTSGSDSDRFGHVTPFLFLDPRDQSYSLFVGAARSATWDHNLIARIKLSAAQQKLINEEAAPALPKQRPAATINSAK
jgi:sucrose-6-phosphate hydrolase SacC (GH32 family)